MERGGAAGADASTNNKLWRIHAAFDLPSERFGFFELTDQHEAERLDRVPVVKARFASPIGCI